MMKKNRCLFGMILVLGSLAFAGFNYFKHSIPVAEIHEGGPPKDGIPALTDPELIEAKEADFLDPGDRVLGIEINGEAVAYPVSIMNWHEIVNATVGGEDVLISFCPLCGTGMAFKARIDGARRLFGVSGKIYNSDVLFYDKKTESLWSQLLMEAVTGPMTGTRLTPLPLDHTTWKAWKKQYPRTRVLSTRTGYWRDYHKDPYSGYDKTERTFFPVSNADARLSKKSWVLGIFLDGLAKAYPFDDLARAKTPIRDFIKGREIWVHYDKRNRSAWIVDAEQKKIPSVQAYWFAWAAFYPDTALWRSDSA